MSSYKIKKRLMQMALDYRKRQQPFDVHANESYQLPSDAPHEINNSHFLGAHDCKGNDLTLRYGFRHGGEQEIFFIVRLNGEVFYMEHDHYDETSFPGSASCIVEGKQWRFTFLGNLLDEKGNNHTAAFDGVFESALPIYDFLNTPRTNDGMTSAIARERWNRRFFAQLSACSQRHYEQVGHLRASLVIDGQTTAIDWSAVRDHADGKRVWDQMNCHIWLNATTYSGEGLTFSLVSYPHLKSLFSGYLSTVDGRYLSLVGYKDIQYSHNAGQGCDSFSVLTQWSDGTIRLLQATREKNVLCTFDDGVYIFQEGLGAFTIGGVKAQGNLEYGFNRNSERWGTYETSVEK